MSGIYIHIPFCKQACHYCDFHFSTNTDNLAPMHRAICDEIILKRNLANGEVIHTIYFGGGTPSLFTGIQLDEILTTVSQHYTVSPHAEITLEANPDDLDKEKLKFFLSIGINRLSIGIQTFDDARLKYINRAHTSQEAKQSVIAAYEAGFSNISGDLIYAIPPSDLEYWRHDLQTMIQMGLPHISIYGLTIEDKTVFGRWKMNGRFKETEEEIAATQYKMTIDQLTKAGYRQYEVSNFAKPGFESRHNGAYWSGEKYIGIGPGAHSYDLSVRSFNIANNAKYIQSIGKRQIPESFEALSEIQKVNEHILTRLRTAEGIDLGLFMRQHGISLSQEKSKEISDLIIEGLIKNCEERVSLTTQGFMVADEIALRLFYDE